MDESQIKLALVLKALDIDPHRTDNFRQKKNGIYLASIAGTPASNHHFYWHYSGRIAAK